MHSMCHLFMSFGCDRGEFRIIVVGFIIDHYTEKQVYIVVVGFIIDHYTKKQVPIVVVGYIIDHYTERQVHILQLIILSTITQRNRCILLWLVQGIQCLMPLSTIFQLYHGVSFIGGGNRIITWRKPPTSHKSLTNFITYCCS